MYKVIGSDGREYGPVNAEQLRQWIAQGRANAQTLTQSVGTTDWKPLGSFPEFIQVTLPIAAVAPPPAPAGRPVTPPSTNSMAVAGLVFGLLGLTGGWMCCGGPMFSVLGVVFSSVGLSQIKRNPIQETGKGMATTGLVLSVVGLVAAVVLGIVFGTLGFVGHHPLNLHRQWRF